MSTIDWKTFLFPYEQMVNELVVKFENISKSFSNTGEPSPIEHVAGRVKTTSSILDKANRKGIDLKDISEKIEDIGGIRIVCRFVEDINRIVYIIRARDDLEVIRELDYVTEGKPSGYRSFHIKIKYKLCTMEGPKELICEIQIRTLAMNFWATIEHSLRYKYNYNIPEDIKERLRISAEAAFRLDEEMSTIRDEIVEVQKNQLVKNELVDQTLKKLQGLHSAVKSENVMELYDKFYQLYSEGDLSKLQDFYKQLKITTQIYEL